MQRDMTRCKYAAFLTHSCYSLRIIVEYADSVYRHESYLAAPSNDSFFGMQNGVDFPALLVLRRAVLQCELF
jgi:hypothetical protein